MRKMTVTEREQFLAEPRVGIVCIASDDGRPPAAVPVWYAYEPGGMLRFFTGSAEGKNRKTRLIERARALSFSVQHDTPPYRFVTIEGTVTDIEDTPAVDDILAIVSRYLPPDMVDDFVRSEFDQQEREKVLFRIRPDRWITGDFSE